MTTTRRRWVKAGLLLLAGLLVFSLIGLGNWQMRRLAWKRDLIEAIETRAYSDPVAPPDSASFDAERDAYRRVAVSGTYLHDRSALVKAVTEIGPGYWLMTPLETNGRIVWINRGFLPYDRQPPGSHPPGADGITRVTGLLRPAEPGGTFLESNDPEAGRWVSRDVAALSGEAEFGPTAPFFIDADHVGGPSGYPRGGMTIVTFRNNHLSYALTWYAMALLLAGALFHVLRSRRRKGGT